MVLVFKTFILQPKKNTSRGAPNNNFNFIFEKWRVYNAMENKDRKYCEEKLFSGWSGQLPKRRKRGSNERPMKGAWVAGLEKIFSIALLHSFQLSGGMIFNFRKLAAALLQLRQRAKGFKTNTAVQNGCSLWRSNKLLRCCIQWFRLLYNLCK